MSLVRRGPVAVAAIAVICLPSLGFLPTLPARHEATGARTRLMGHLTAAAFLQAWSPPAFAR